MQLSDLSQLDLYFLLPLVREALSTHAPVIHATMKTTEGDDWLARFNQLAAAYRAELERRFKEESEASEAVAELNGLRGRYSAWKSHLTNISKREQAPPRREALLKAIGYGDPTPRTAKDFKDSMARYGALVSARKDQFAALGARPSALEFATAMSTKLDEASAKVMREEADVSTARGNVAEKFAAALERVRMVDTTAVAERDGALFDEDPAVLEKANELLALLDRALARAKEQARTHQQSNRVPEEVTTPVATPLTEGGNNHGN